MEFMDITMTKNESNAFHTNRASHSVHTTGHSMHSNNKPGAGQLNVSSETEEKKIARSFDRSKI